MASLLYLEKGCYAQHPPYDLTSLFMNEQKFWELIESAWKSVPLLDGLRQEALKTNKADLFRRTEFRARRRGVGSH
jgi:hypothetical protein